MKFKDKAWIVFYIDEQQTEHTRAVTQIEFDQMLVDDMNMKISIIHNIKIDEIEDDK